MSYLYLFLIFILLEIQKHEKESINIDLLSSKSEKSKIKNENENINGNEKSLCLESFELDSINVKSNNIDKSIKLETNNISIIKEPEKSLKIEKR